jgi:hypothetical protein
VDGTMTNAQLTDELKRQNNVVLALKNALLDLDVLPWSVEQVIKTAYNLEEVGFNG